jgi:sugar/nucleoside kinase (ribokinase family)
LTLIVVGDLVTDVLVLPDGPLAVGSDTAGTVRVTGGGQAANTAAWSAHVGRSTTLVAAVGSDDAGRARAAELTSMGVRCAVRAHQGAATGSVVVLAAGGERTMITDRAAALLLDPADVTAAVLAERDAVHLHLSGYPLLDPRSRAGGLAALAAARRRGLTTSVDAASAAPLRAFGAAAFLDVVRDADLLLANADEAVVLAGPGDADQQASALARVVRHAVVKRGDGAVWCSHDGSTAAVAVERVPPIDPTGAGDAFAAGFLDAWLSGADPAAALAAGTALGVQAVAQVGARPPPPT